MRLTNFLIALAILLFTAGISSCKKNNTTTTSETQTTIALSTDQAISDNLNSDAENVLNEAAVQNNFSGNTPVSVTTTMNVLSCATVTVTPAQGFPKNITIDFGTGCTSTSGITRSGKIYVTLSDSLRKSGSIAVMTFDNYYVGGFKKEGTLTWTNTSQGSIRSWERKCENGKVTAPDGHYWIHNGTKTVVETAGWDTPLNLTDDVYSITGSSSITNSAGNTRTAVIVTALEKKVACDNIDMGTIKIQGPNHYAIIDYGDGTCDRIATIAIDGGTPISILLR